MLHLAGKFIVFDGTEGCGKSTQAHLLQATLEQQGQPTLLVRDPGATRIGEMVRQILLDPANDEMGMRCEMLLYMATRAQLMSQVVMPALAAGKTVLSDRFVSSTLAYQLHGDGLTAEEITAVGGIAINNRWPDLTILLDLPAEESLRRVRPKFALFPNDPEAGMQKDRIERRPMEYHGQVRRNYLAQVDAHPLRYRIVDAMQPPAEVQADVLRLLKVFE